MASPDGHQDDTRDLRERLAYIASGDAGTLLAVVGSGVSRGAVAGTEEMTQRFLDALTPALADGIRSRWGSSTPAYVRYQQAAEAVGRQRGDRALTAIVRAAVVEAIDDDDFDPDADLRLAVRERRWKVPKAHRDLAEFYSRLPAEARSPIITTNFDPLIEVALREVGVVADPIPISFDDPPNLAQLRNSNAVPVIHIHGYFTESWSINSLHQISATRIQLEALLSSLFVDATVLVLGYGGWEDSFMRVLRRHASAQSLLNAEVIWCAYSRDASSLDASPVLSKLLGSPGFQLYSGIDAATLFDAPLGVRSAEQPAAAPRGWTALPVTVDNYRAAREFSEGAAPSWSDAIPGRWPLLSAGKDLAAELSRVIDGDSSASGVAAIGPLGEGKSTALLQTAMIVAERAEWTVLARGTGAPPLTPEWASQSREALGDAVFCIDEADLAAGDIDLLLSHSGKSRSVLLLAAHDRLWWSLPQSTTKRITPVLFDGLSESDAGGLAERWRELGIEITQTTPTGVQVLDTDAVRKRLIERSRSGHHVARTTLFGAILSTHEKSTLATRVDELMDRLSRSKARASGTLSLAEVYGAICLMQVATDREGDRLRGATRALIGEMVNGEGSLENVTVLNALGREASITFAGRHVYARHPLIAEAAVDWLRRDGRLASVAELCGRAGARMRTGGAERSDYQDAYMLGKSLTEPSIALAACKGAIEGAPNLLQPRITYLSVARAHNAETAAKYARGIVPLLGSAADSRTAIRVYLNELARVELQENHARIALGVSGLILHNGSGLGANREQMEYGLGTMASAYRMLLRQHSGQYEKGAQLLIRVASLVMAPEALERFVRRTLSAVSIDAAVVRLPLGAALDRLARELSPFSKAAVEELGLPFGPSEKVRAAGRFVFHGGLEFDELRIYERSPVRT